MVQQIAVAKGVQLEIDSITAGGATLEDHIAAGTVQKRLERKAFSAVILQEQSGRQVLEVDAYETSARTLAAFARIRKTRVFIYMGWTQQNAVQQYGYTQQNWTDSALRVARAIGSGVAPVGEAWLYAKRRDKALQLAAKRWQPRDLRWVIRSRQHDLLRIDGRFTSQCSHETAIPTLACRRCRQSRGSSARREPRPRAGISSTTQTMSAPLT